MEEIIVKKDTGDIVSVERGSAKDTIKEVTQRYARSCMLIMGPECATKTVVMNHFVNDRHCVVGGNPSYLLNNPADVIRETLIVNDGEVVLFDIQESDVISREKRNRMVAKLTEAGFSDIIGVYIDNSGYLGDGAEIARKLLSCCYGGIAVSVDEDLPEKDKDFIERTVETINYPNGMSEQDRDFIERVAEAINHPKDMNEQSLEVCRTLAADPPLYNEFSGGLIRMEPSWMNYLSA